MYTVRTFYQIYQHVSLTTIEGSQMIPRIVFGSMFPCLRISFSSISRVLSSKFVTLIIVACRTNRMFASHKSDFWKMNHGGPIYRDASKRNHSVLKMILLLSVNSDILELTAEQLQFIPKIVLLRNFGAYVGRLWDKLPEHIKADSEIQQYRHCTQHYNLSWQQTHIDGPTPLIKNCCECQREL